MSKQTPNRSWAERFIDTALLIFAFVLWWWPSVPFTIRGKGRRHAYGELCFSFIGIATLTVLAYVLVYAFLGILPSLWLIAAVGAVYVVEFLLYLVWERWKTARFSIAHHKL